MALVMTSEECARVVANFARCFDELGRRAGAVGTDYAMSGARTNIAPHG